MFLNILNILPINRDRVLKRIEAIRITGANKRSVARLKAKNNRIKIGANILLTASLPAISPMTKITTDKILKLPLLWIKAENSKLEAATIHKRISDVARTAPEDLTVSVLKA